MNEKEINSFKNIIITHAEELSKTFIEALSNRNMDNFEDLVMAYEIKSNEKTYRLVFKFEENKEK